MGYKVLAVDDEKDTLDLFRTIFESEGGEVHTLEDGSMTVEKAKELRPDVILLDIMMPSMNGWVVFLNLQKDPDTKNIPILIISAKPLSEDSHSKVYHLGIVDYILKPFEIDDLVEKVKSVVNLSKSG